MESTGFLARTGKTDLRRYCENVMVLSLLAAQKSVEVANNANKLTRQALRSSYIPWPKLMGFSISRKGEDIANLNFRLKNFSPTAPAINLTIESLIPKILNER